MNSILEPDWPAPAGVVAGTTPVATPPAELPPGIGYLRQVHGTTVATAAAVRRAADPVEADAVTGQQSGDICAVRTADCLPVLFAAVDGSRVAAAHAGWRGLAAGVLENTVAALQGTELMAWIGPGISQPNYEVGEEVREAFIAADAAAARHFEPNARGRWPADLVALARQRPVPLVPP